MNNRFFQTFHPSPENTFVMAFCWAFLGGLLLQFVVLPAFPSLHAGHGLLKGGDWNGFHVMGKELALQMAQDGWGVWELRYLGNAPSGLLAALYFAVGIYEPWLFLPINALLFGTAAAMLHKTFKLIVTTRHSFFAVLPFVMFPSALMIYGQVHKDIFSITGTFFILFVWVDLTQRTALTWCKIMVQIVIMLTGLTLVWIVRPYLLQSMLVVGLFAALLLSLRVGRKGFRSWWCALVIFLSIQLLAALYSEVDSASPAHSSAQSFRSHPSAQSFRSHPSALPELDTLIGASGVMFNSFVENNGSYVTWRPSSAGDLKVWTWSGWVKRWSLGRQDRKSVV